METLLFRGQNTWELLPNAIENSESLVSKTRWKNGLLWVHMQNIHKPTGIHLTCYLTLLFYFISVDIFIFAYFFIKKKLAFLDFRFYAIRFYLAFTFYFVCSSDCPSILLSSSVCPIARLFLLSSYVCPIDSLVINMVFIFLTF